MINPNFPEVECLHLHKHNICEVCQKPSINFITTFSRKDESAELYNYKNCLGVVCMECRKMVKETPV